MCFVAVDSWFELLMSGREAVSRTIKSMSRSNSLWLHLHLRAERPPKERPHFAALPPQRRLFQFLPSVSTGTRLQRARSVFPPLRRLLKYASAPRAIWSGLDQCPVPVFFLFMRILPRKALVNLSDIISEVGGVIDCGSNGERKSGRPDINIPCQFSVCLLVSC